MKKTLIIAFLAFLMVGCNFATKNNSTENEIYADSIDIDHDRLMGYLTLIDTLAQAEFKEKQDIIEENRIDLSPITGIELTDEDFDEVNRLSQQAWDNLVALVNQKHYKDAVDFYFEHAGEIFNRLKTSQGLFELHKNVIAPIVPMVYPKEQADSVLISDIEFIRIITEAAMITVPTYRPEHYNEVLFLASQYYYNQYDYDKAIETVHVQREWAKTAYGEDSYEYGLTLANEAMSLIEKKEYDKCLELFDEARGIFSILTDKQPENENYRIARDLIWEYIIYVYDLINEEREGQRDDNE
ncbi:MAG: hypothetical protein IJX68_08915 [Rikenellaceae bacterium]|nr:hypothetical protein [Rikenellaceae bacterium]